jgi:hypothetical protein
MPEAAAGCEASVGEDRTAGGRFAPADPTDGEDALAVAVAALNQVPCHKVLPNSELRNSRPLSL